MRKLINVILGVVVTISACKKEDNSNITNAVVIKNNITTALTLGDTLTGTDYIIDGCVEVEGVTLTFKPGVTVVFKSGACLRMINGGALNAVGLDTAKITFRGEQTTKGFWQGLYYSNSNSAANVLENVVITDAGGNATNFENAAVNVGNTPIIAETSPSRIKMNKVSISNSGGYGVYIAIKTSVDQFDNNTISGCSKFPVLLTACNAGVLNATNTFTGNAIDRIEINGAMVQTETTVKSYTLAKLGVPYELNGVLAAENATVTIAPGAEIIAASNAMLRTYDNGNITANGSAANKIVFKGKEATKGYWRGFLNESNGYLFLNHCNISDAGNAKNDLNIPMGSICSYGDPTTKATLNITNCSISNSTNNGMAIRIAGTNYNLNIGSVNTFTGIDDLDVETY